MSDGPTLDRADLPLELVHRIDLVCDRFEEAWRRGERPRAEDFLDGFDGPHRLALLRDLMAAEIDARRRLGERPRPDEYRERSPRDAAVIGDAFGARRGGPPGVETFASDSSVEAALDGTTGQTFGRSLPGEGPASTYSLGARIRYFGDFELLQILGQGGMGVVYKARQQSLNRMVAIKMIRAGTWASDDEVRRFRNEAESVANLDHPQIVTIHEVGEHDGRHYFSMKLIDGPSLAEQLPRYAADPRAAARLVAEGRLGGASRAPAGASSTAT